MSRRLPRGERQQQGRGRPEAVEDRAFDVRAGRHLEQVDAVGNRHGDQAGTDQGPVAAGSPAGHREGADDEREQQDVPERVGQVRDDLRGSAARGVEDDLEEHRRPDGRRRRGGDQPVHPDAEPEAPAARPQQEDEARIRRDVEAEVEGVGERRIGRLAAGGEHRPGDVPGRPEEQRDREHEPAETRRTPPDRARETENGRRQHQAVVEPLVEDGSGPAPVEVQGAVAGMSEQRQARQRLGRPDDVRLPTNHPDEASTRRRRAAIPLAGEPDRGYASDAGSGASARSFRAASTSRRMTCNEPAIGIAMSAPSTPARSAPMRMAMRTTTGEIRTVRP